MEAVFFPEAKRVARGFQARGGEGFSLASAVRAVCLGMGGGRWWWDGRVRRWEVRVERFFFVFFLKILKYLFGKGGVVTHQTAAGPPAGHVCLTTGSESSPLLA